MLKYLVYIFLFTVCSYFEANSYISNTSQSDCQNELNANIALNIENGMVSVFEIEEDDYIKHVILSITINLSNKQIWNTFFPQSSSLKICNSILLNTYIDLPPPVIG